MGAVWLRSRGELRHRWKAWLAVALLAGIGGGIAMGAFAAADRVDRLHPGRPSVGPGDVFPVAAAGNALGTTFEKFTTLEGRAAHPWAARLAGPVTRLVPPGRSDVRSSCRSGLCSVVSGLMASQIDERIRAAAALRDLIHAFVAHDRDTDGLRELEEMAGRHADAMRDGVRRDRLALMRAAREAAPPGTTFVAGGPGSGFEDRAVGGRANPTSVDLDVTFEGDEVVAEVVLHRAFEGAPGRAHGGIVSAVFDDVTGFVIGNLGEPAFTGELTVRFVAPVPVEEPLVIRARLEGRERRKLFITAEASVGDAVVATCKAIYITVDPSIFAGAPDPR